VTNVLIADDSTIIQKLISGVLQKDSSINIVGLAGNGQEVVEKTRELKPDIILMDYRMPKQNAPEAIKQIMSTQPTPILVITSAEPVDEKKSEVLKLGAVGFMEKPKNMDFNPLSVTLLTNIKTLSRLKPSKKTY
jgi:two-component system chemotaxis response regulator CheB